MKEVGMNTGEFFELLPLLAPLLLVWFGLLVAGLVDLIPRQQTRGPKWVWYVVVICFSMVGPVTYFLFGREET
jgi:hypothetical protein